MSSTRKLLLLAAVLIAMMTLSAVSAAPPSEEPTAVRLVTGLEGGAGSTLGPGGALYVTEGLAGRISRVDPQTGEVTTVASGLPKPGIPGYPFGGPVAVVFLGTTAYVLVAVVAPSDVVGIYRVDGPDSFTVVADIGTFSEQNPPRDPVHDPRGGQYALEPYRGGFLVTDGHHNRVLRVTLDGEVSEVIAFGNIVPTGLAVSGPTVYMAEAGPVPHRPEDGKVVAFEPTSPSATEVAARARCMPSRRGTLRPMPRRGLRRCRTPGRSSGSTRTARLPSSRLVWTNRPRSSLSGIPPMLSPSPGRSGRSTASRIRPRTWCIDHPGA
jgi:hypothetical protein